MPPGGPDDLDPTAKSPSSQSSPASPPDPAFTFTSAAGLSIDAHVIAEPLEEPTALAFAAGGTLFVAERAGRVRILRGGRLRPVPALVLDDVAADGGLLTLAVDPQFERSGFVYLVYAGDRGLRLARYRVVADTLGERAILLDGLPFAPGRPAAWLRFGPDAKLYLGLDDGGDPRNAGDLGSFSGKVLRLNPDGTTPADQDGLSPVYALDFNAPREGTWSASGRVLWVADNPGAETGQLHVVAEDAAADGRRSGKTVTRYALPEGTAAAGLTFYHEELLPAFRDSLLVALNGPAGSPALLMLSIDASNPTRVTNTEHLLDSLPEPIRAIAVSPDGVVYLGTPSRLLALAPARER
jgi:glucose/arabinose dehydrogenase